MASDTALSRLLAHVTNVRVAALAAGVNSVDCLTLNRFLGKAMLLLEAMFESEKGAALSEDVIDDFNDALISVSDAVESVRRMSRLQALIHADDIRESLKAAGADLRLAVEALSSFHSSFPPDAREDLIILLRQLTSLRLVTRPSWVITSTNLLHALTLDNAGVALLPATGPTSPGVHRGSSSSTGGSVLTALNDALSLVGFSTAPAASWVNEELFHLGQGVLDSGKEGADPIDSFHLLRAALVLLRWSLANLNTDLAENASDQGQSTCSWGENCSRAVQSRWARLARFAGADNSCKENTACFACALGLSPSTLAVLEDAYNVGEACSLKVNLNMEDPVGLCNALRMKWQVCDDDEDNTSPEGTLILQYQAAELMAHAADCGFAGKLVEAGAINALLSALESSTHAAVRAAVATALRTLCRDAAAREAAAAAGCIRPLARHLQSPNAGPRRAAARALGNVLVAGEGWKREAVERFSISQSLVAMLRSDDAIGQEASASALANLAANSEAVQTAVGKTDVFVPLIDMLNNGATPIAQQNAARALRNLTSRVHCNRLKAAAAGAVPALTNLLEAADPSSRAAAANALATLMEGCRDTVTQAVEVGAVTKLQDMLQEDHSLACRNAAAAALVHICHTNSPCRHGSSMSDSSNGSGVPVPLGLDACPSLVALLTSGSAAGRRASARLLAYLAKRTSRDAVVAAGAIPPLVALLENNQDAVRRGAVTAMCALLHRCDLGKHQFLGCNGASSIVSLLDKGEPEEEITREEAARALGILCSNNKFHQGEICAAAGAIPALVRAMNDGAPPTQKAAAVALSNLACLPSNQLALSEAGAGLALLRLLRTEGVPGGPQAAARGLSNIVADGVPAELEHAVSDMATMFAELALSEDMEGYQIVAAGALSNLACSDAHAAEAVGRYGGAAALAQLCRSESPLVRETAAQGLWEACRASSEAREVAVSQGVVPWLVQLLLVGGDCAKEAAAGCIAELTRCGEEVCKEAEIAGAPQLLQRLANQGSSEVAVAAAAALKALNARSPDSPTVERQLSMRLSSLRQAGSRRWDSGVDLSLSLEHCDEESHAQS